MTHVILTFWQVCQIGTSSREVKRISTTRENEDNTGVLKTRMAQMARSLYKIQILLVNYNGIEVSHWQRRDAVAFILPWFSQTIP